MRYIGIDPGASGGIAAVDDDGRAWACPMPKTLAGILFALGRAMRNASGLRVVLEHVWTSPQMGVVSAGSFMFNFGALQMALTSLEARYDLVAPVKWQNAMGARTPKGRRAELGHKDKNITKTLAQNLFPDLRVTHAIADALLLAEYARRTAGLLDLSEERDHGDEEEGEQEEAGEGEEAGGAEEAAAKAAAADRRSAEGPGARRDLRTHRRSPADDQRSEAGRGSGQGQGAGAAEDRRPRDVHGARRRAGAHDARQAARAARR